MMKHWPPAGPYRYAIGTAIRWRRASPAHTPTHTNAQQGGFCGESNLVTALDSPYSAFTNFLMTVQITRHRSSVLAPCRCFTLARTPSSSRAATLFAALTAIASMSSDRIPSVSNQCHNGSNACQVCLRRPPRYPRPKDLPIKDGFG